MGWNVRRQEWIDTPKGDEVPNRRPDVPRPVSPLPELKAASGPTSTVPMEVARRSDVHKGVGLDTEVVQQLSVGTSIQLLSTSVLDDGTKRACVAISGGSSSIGWITTETADGVRLLHRFARPIHVVVGSSLKVRKQPDTDSTFVTQLMAGSRVHIAEIKKLPDGSTRARVVILDRSKVSCDRPVGWITAAKSDGECKLAELATDDAQSNDVEDGVHVDSETGAAELEPTPVSQLRVCSPPYGDFSSEFSPPRPTPSQPTKPRAGPAERTLSPPKATIGFLGNAGIIGAGTDGSSATGTSKRTSAASASSRPVRTSRDGRRGGAPGTAPAASPAASKWLKAEQKIEQKNKSTRKEKGPFVMAPSSEVIATVEKTMAKAAALESAVTESLYRTLRVRVGACRSVCYEG